MASGAYANTLLQRPSAPLPPAARAIETSLSPGVVQGRPSYDLGGLGNLLGPWRHLPIHDSFALFERLKEAVPLIDAAIVHITELVGCPSIEAEDDVKKEIDDWLWRRLRVNQVQVGLGNFISTWLDDMLTYGRSHAEIVLTNRRDDVFGLFELHPGTIAFSQTDDGYSLNTVQYGRLAQPVLFPEWKVLTAVNRIRTDDPNGTSLLWGLPLVTETYIAMVESQKQLYTRFGTPTYHVNWVPPDNWNDPQGTQAAKIMSPIKSGFQSAMSARADGKIKDFFSTGAVTVTVVGAAGEELKFTESGQAILEQIVAKTGLPPMIFGLPWSTTERMSTVQSSLLAEMVDRLQQQITPEIKRLIDLRQALSGGSLEYELKWEGANLQDELQTHQAEFQKQEAVAVKWQNLTDQWRAGMLTVFEMVREFRPDMEKLSDEEIKAKLPDLQLEPPQAPEPLLPKPVTGAQGAQPGMNHGPGNNRAPSATKSLSYHDDWTPPLALTNGNGRHP